MLCYKHSNCLLFTANKTPDALYELFALLNSNSAVHCPNKSCFVKHPWSSFLWWHVFGFSEEKDNSLYEPLYVTIICHLQSLDGGTRTRGVERLEFLVKQNVKTFNEFVAEFSWYKDPTLP